MGLTFTTVSLFTVYSKPQEVYYKLPTLPMQRQQARWKQNTCMDTVVNYQESTTQTQQAHWRENSCMDKIRNYTERRLATHSWSTQ